MASRESSLGAWADKIPPVDGFVGPARWDGKAVYSAPLTPDAVAHEMKRVGVLLLMGLAPMLVAGGLVAMDLDVILHGERTTGTVVELRPGPRGYAPVAAFSAGGAGYRVRGKVFSKTLFYEVGDAIPVRYNPNDPSEAAIGGFLMLYLVPMIIGGVGFFFVLLALGCGVHILRRASRELGAWR